MRIIMILMLGISSISLTACSSMSGNVVPESGPTMEQVYDNMETADATYKSRPPEIRPRNTLPLNAMTDASFHKLPNPELKMYVFPHLAGNDEVPVPGYYTVFNAYTQDHYALPNEIIRE
jgi:conjugative transfer region lipoprotein (TIGR03751 family)